MSATVGKPTKTNKITVSFVIKKEAAQNAAKIDLLCEHNGWQPVAMKPQKNGTFKGSISIPADGKVKYAYKFKYTFADDTTKFDNDWDAEGYSANPFGGEDSYFLTVKE